MAVRFLTCVQYQPFTATVYVSIRSVTREKTNKDVSSVWTESQFLKHLFVKDLLALLPPGALSIPRVYVTEKQLQHLCRST